MSTETDIINEAYGIVGEDRIISPTDTTRQAEIARLFYDTSLEFVLRHRDWNCARRRATLSLLDENIVTVQQSEFTYAFVVPSDCLALRRMTGYSKFPPYSLETIKDNDNVIRVLYTNRNPTTIVYTARIEAPHLDPMLKECVVLKLATRFATASRVRDLRWQTEVLKQYGAMLIEAVGVDEAESDIDTGRDRTLTEVR